jgi:hypothetical protein
VKSASRMIARPRYHRHVGVVTTARRWPLAFLVLASFAAAYVLTACSLLADFDVPLGPASGTGGPSPGKPVVLTFEDGRPACGFTRMDQGSATPDTDARTGTGSCRICASASNSNIRAQADVPDDAGIGTYVLDVWFKQLAGAQAPPTWALRLESRFDPSTDAGPRVDTETGRAGQTWILGQVTLAVNKPPSKVFALIGAESSLNAGDCLLVDDVEIAFQPQ